jgi:hypothetical protein
MEVHHLIHNKRPDRRRKDDRLVWPLSVEDHRLFHGKKGAEKKFFKSHLGIPDIYVCGEWLWQIWCEHGRDGEELAIAYVREVSYGIEQF